MKLSTAARYLVVSVALALAYVIAGLLGIAASTAEWNVALVWPPAGLALAALVLAGVRHTPAVFVGALAATLLSGIPFAVALGIAFGSTAAAVFGAALLTRLLEFDASLKRVRDALLLAFPAALGASLIAALVGVASLAAGGLVGPERYAAILLTWWAGDALGVLLFAPLALLWYRDLRPDREVALAAGYAVLVAVLLLGGDLLLERYAGRATPRFLADFALFPLAVWPAVRFRMREIATFNVVVALICIMVATVVFGMDDALLRESSVVTLHAALGVMALASLLVGAFSGERRDGAARLAESEARFRSLAELSADWYWEQDSELRFTVFSRGFAGATGLDATHFLGRCRWELPGFVIAGDGLARHMQALETRQPFRELLLQYTHPDGTVRFFMTSGEPVFGHAGEFCGYRGVGRDITAQKRAELELRESRELFAHIFHSSPQPMLFTRLSDQVVTEVNGAWCALFGREPAHVIGKTLNELDVLVFPEERSRLLRVLRERGEVQQVEVQVRAHGGEIREVLFSGETVEMRGELCVVSSLFDVTERNRVQAALRESRESLEQMFRASPLPVALSGVEDGRVIDVNDAWAQTFGYVREQILGKNFIEVGLWVSLEARRQLRDILKSAGHVKEFECRWRRRTGEIADVLLSAGLIELGGQQVMLSNAVDVTERKLAERRLRESEARFAKIFRTNPLPVVISRLSDGLYVDVNEAWGRFFGWSREEFTGKTSISLGIWVNPAERDEFVRVASQGGVQALETHFRKKSGEIADVLLTAELIELAGEQCLLTTVLDITERKRAEQQLRQSERRFRDFAEAAGEYLWELDVDGRFTFASRRVEQVLGYTPAELYGRRPFEFMPIGEQERMRDWYAEATAARAAFRNVEHRSLTRSGSQVWQLVSGVPVLDGDGVFVGFRGTALDITERKQAEARISELATRDPLTGLPNRLLLTDRIARAIATANRQATLLALMFIDLDHFKGINDTLGHEVGDELLKEVAKRIGSVLRKGDTLSRLGGDEFVIVLEDLKAAEDAGQVAQKIINALAQPCEIDGHTLNTACSVGISIYPSDAGDATTLMRHADTAMYVAKSSGRKNYQFFSVEMNTRATERLKFESGLRGAIERNELRVFYQPRVDVATGQLTGAEALLRWQHPEKGLIGASRFLAIVEETGMIQSVGEWVLRCACDQVQAWHSLLGPAFAVSVNVSQRQFNRTLPALVREALDESGLDPRMLELEINEATLSRSLDDAKAVLGGLRSLGVRVVLDDFGTGYSSMRQLRQLAVDGIKIDRSFVRGLNTNPDDRIVVKAMIDMARSLRINTIAEGVETEHELQLLRAMGCEEYAGFSLGEPVAPVEFEHRWVRADNVVALKTRR